MDINHKSILVSGGAGFIGSRLSETLVSKGAHVTIVDNLSNGTMQNISRKKDSVKFHNLDIISRAFRNLLIEEK